MVYCNMKTKNKISPEYRAWLAMRRRCNNDKSKNFKYYGAKGISVCERWKSYHEFLKDMGTRPSCKHSLDRINVLGNYSPDNCRWATFTVQMNNTTRSKIITLNEITKTLIMWCRHYSISRDVVKTRVKLGWDIQKALNYPVVKRTRTIKSQRMVLDTNNGIFYESIAEAARSLNHNECTLSNKLNNVRKNNSCFIFA